MDGENADRIVAAEREIRDREAPLYDRHRERAAYDRRAEDGTVITALDLQPDLVVVDAGCGTGRQLLDLLERSARVVGVDHSEASLDIARERVRVDLRGRLQLLAGDVRSLPLENETADRVLCSEVIQHVPGNEGRRQALKELHRILRPGGILVITAYRWHGHIRRTKDGFFENGLYRYAFTAREFGALMRSAGFEEVRIGGTVVLPRLSERLGVSFETQRRLAFTPVGRHLAHYVIGRAVSPGAHGATGRG
jgi:ubiquinone/menaquinone biosynthesis C-methylase UbiE